MNRFRIVKPMDSPLAGPSMIDTPISMTPDLPDSDIQTDFDEEEEIIEDGGFTIRIPNPKFYMARPTQWKGRRGKPRCDNCRINNLKVRVIPNSKFVAQF